MLFNSYEFVLCFLPIVVAGHWTLVRVAGRTAALGWLILASTIFYARASVTALAVIFPSIAFDFLLARAMLLDSQRPRVRGALLMTGVAANVLLLGYFKYRNFFLDTSNLAFGTHFELTHLLVPLGLSFLVFQKIAFLADVHAGQVKAVPLVVYLVFTLFFPRTVAGPIVRYGEIAPQLADLAPRAISTDIAVGLSLFAIGLFKKTVLADNLASMVIRAYGGGEPIAFIQAWTGILAYTLQLYFDFSGYSDMALGAARSCGIRLPVNFNSPLKATSIVDYWARWHITLTRFLTAYVYTPLVVHLTRARAAAGKPILSGKRSSPTAIISLVATPTLVTMTISGFWHGAGWQFIAWGVLHGLYLTINQTWRMFRPRLWVDRKSYERLMRPVGFALTFFAVVIALVFFRAPSLSSALHTLDAMTGRQGFLPYNLRLIHNFGFSLPAQAINLVLPFTTFFWLAVLFALVLWSPNSMELLRQFGPAADFPTHQHTAIERPAAAQIHPDRASGGGWLTAGARAAWRTLARVRQDGIALNQVAAILLALIFMTGMIGISANSTFLYEQF
jgi:alginate O-acetyltransferase complex protein AlgI